MMSDQKMTKKQLRKEWRKYLLEELLPYVNEVVEFVNGDDDDEASTQDDEGPGPNPPGPPPPPPGSGK